MLLCGLNSAQVSLLRLDRVDFLPLIGHLSGAFVWSKTPIRDASCCVPLADSCPMFAVWTTRRGHSVEGLGGGPRRTPRDGGGHRVAAAALALPRLARASEAATALQPHSLWRTPRPSSIARWASFLKKASYLIITIPR